MGKIQGLFKDLSRFFNFQGLFKGLMLFQGLFKARANHVSASPRDHQLILRNVSADIGEECVTSHKNVCAGGFKTRQVLAKLLAGHQVFLRDGRGEAERSRGSPLLPLSIPSHLTPGTGY